MRKLILLFIITLSLISYGQKNTISGTLTGFKDGDKIKLFNQKQISHHQKDTL
jgi:hypothetical protein